MPYKHVLVIDKSGKIGRFFELGSPGVAGLRDLVIMGTRPEIASDQVSGTQPARLHTAEARRKSGRSRIANGAGTMLPMQDGRSLWARIRKDTYRALVVHCGGDQQISETQSLLSRRVATLEAELLYYEDQFAQIRAEGGVPDPQTVDLYGRLADRQRRLAGEAVGWRRTPRDLNEGFGDAWRADIEERRREEEAADAERASVRPPPLAGLLAKKRRRHEVRSQGIETL
jgi:hypothetical protein